MKVLDVKGDPIEVGKPVKLYPTGERAIVERIDSEGEFVEVYSQMLGRERFETSEFNESAGGRICYDLAAEPWT